MSDPSWLGWARRIQSIAQAGLTYAKDPYDRERYAALQDLAAEIVAGAAGLDLEAVTAIFRAEKGYLTPKVDVRAAVFREERILLVQERQDGRWSLPGGWADVGDSPSEAATREVLEESGLRVRPVKLLAVYDRGRHTERPGLWYTYKLFLHCVVLGGTLRPSIETADAAFFAETDLPPLSEQRVTPAQVARMFAHLRAPELPADFD